MYKALHLREDIDLPYDKEKEEEKFYSISEITSTLQSMNLKSASNITTTDYSQKQTLYWNEQKNEQKHMKTIGTQRGGQMHLYGHIGRQAERMAGKSTWT